MADITKCGGLNCIIKEHCKRYTIKADEYYQSTFIKTPFKIKHRLFKCEFFMGDQSLLIFEQLKELYHIGKKG